MEKSKKILIIIAAFFCFMSIVKAETVYTTAKGFDLTDKQLLNLKELGFSEKEINSMDREEINYNKDTEAKLVDSNTIYSKIVYTYKVNNISAMSLNKKSVFSIIDNDYIDLDDEKNLVLVDVKSYNISEEEYNNLGKIPEYSVNAENIVETTGKKLVTTISYISSSNRYRLKNTLTWKNMPKNRHNELYGIIYEEGNANTVVGSQKAYYNYTIDNLCYGTCEDFREDYSNVKYWNTKTKSYYMSFPLKVDKSVTYNWPLPSLGTPETTCPCINPPALHMPNITRVNKVTAMSATMYYDIFKSATPKITALTVAGEYQHAYEKLETSISLSFGIKDFGINIDTKYVTKYDGMRNTKVQVTGINW